VLQLRVIWSAATLLHTGDSCGLVNGLVMSTSDNRMVNVVDAGSEFWRIRVMLMASDTNQWCWQRHASATCGVLGHSGSDLSGLLLNKISIRHSCISSGPIS
jgi:hypothetical protein